MTYIFNTPFINLNGVLGSKSKLQGSQGQKWQHNYITQINTEPIRKGGILYTWTATKDSLSINLPVIFSINQDSTLGCAC